MTIIESLFSFAESTGDSLFLLAPERSPLTYFGLKAHIEKISSQLSACELKQDDRIAVVMNNGPELATALLAVMAFSTVVPLNPAFTEAELSFSIERLNVRAVVCDQRSEKLLQIICDRLQIRCLPIVVEAEGAAGIFHLKECGGYQENLLPLCRLHPEQIAAVLLTSGTSARTKFVPLSHEKIYRSAKNIVGCFAMTAADRALNVIAFFHIHGFISVLLSTVVVGGSMVCLPKFEAKNFFQTLKDYEPTWYTAGPTVHHAIVEYARTLPLSNFPSSLRIIRSGSAPLSVNLTEEMENLFSVPVIEAFGMTETASTIISNPLPPGKRVAGSVGLPVGCEVRIIDETGNPAPVGSTGEITLRGATIFDGYEEDGLIVSAMTDGWFHTGDLGYADSQGYIYIVGRSKEMINRGGQKIAPREIDEALMAMPSIREAACFGIPHPSLGEDVAVAVVLEPGTILDEQTLRSFLGERLVAYKIPRRIFFVESLPKGPTGKILRNTLVKVLAGICTAPYEEPQTDTQKWLADTWKELLRLECVGLQEDFFELGGDSLLAERLMIEVELHWHKVLPGTVLLETGTIAGLAKKIDQLQDVEEVIVCLQEKGSRLPLLFFHALNGDVMICNKLVEKIGRNQPVYGVRFPFSQKKFSGKIDFAELVDTYARIIREKWPCGPYRLAGHSFGGILAFETARRLEQSGYTVDFLALIDTDLSAYQQRSRRVRRKLSEFLQLSWKQKCRYLFHKLQLGPKAGEPSQNVVRKEMGLVASQYRPSHYDKPIFLFRAQDEEDRVLFGRDSALGWAPWVKGGIKMIDVPGDHHTVMQYPYVEMLAKRLIQEMDALEDIQ